jgi:glycosyltransferase involved in cell wall biosynthesis
MKKTGIKEVCCAMPYFIDEVIVVDNNSDDNTADVARKYGAKVIFAKKTRIRVPII